MGNTTKFAVQLPTTAQDPSGFYKQGLMDKVLNKYPWLKVAGIDDPDTTPGGKVIRGVQYAGANNLITFGTAKYHDVNWVERSDYAREKGYAPVYNIVKDYNKVMADLDKFAMERKPRPTRCSNCYYHNSGDIIYVGGQKVEIFDNFIKVGYHVIPRNLTAATFAICTPVEVETIKKIVITISRNY